MAQLSKSERIILSTLIAEPDGISQFETLRRTAKLSPRGFRTVWGRMANRNMVGWVEGSNLPTITFGGVRALKAA